ncbi:MAG: BrxA/BrxB family bacilliredoxin [Gemmatimonadetes bacterium]|nr:BrxA/BrxB family bacilliredoxin [Gemmatimonadota bacterium]
MNYPEMMIVPMRQELTRAGVEELRTADAVDEAVKRPGTTLVVVNSVCGCAARNARPAITMAMQHGTKPDHATTVFAGQDLDATARARQYFTGYAPSSPSIALLKDGQLVHMIERWQIEGLARPAQLPRATASRSAPSTSALATCCGSTHWPLRRVGTRTCRTVPSRASSTIAVTASFGPCAAWITRSHVPSVGHCLRSATTPACDVESNVSAIVRRAPATIPSARPDTGRPTCVPWW